MKKNPQILVELQEYMGSDEAIANAAWSSTYDKDRREEKYDDPEKVRFVIEQRLFGQDDVHNVPVESVVMRFWMRHPIFSDRQHMTHRLQSANGLSGRYRTMPLDWFRVPEDVQKIFDKAAPHWAEGPEVLYEASCRMATHNYQVTILALKEAEKAGSITNEEFRRAREIARGQLPTAGMVERTFIMNLGSFANYMRKRGPGSHAQLEIQQAACMMLEQVEAAGIAPITIACLKARGWKM